MPPEYVSLGDVARLLKVSERTAARYTQRHDLDFPSPVATSELGELAKFTRGRIWRRAAVEQWAREHLPLKPGRRPRPRD